ncbi:MAG: DUF1080 domain-containing protein [Bacteroidia bacterium]|nr:DUF1080 domain-containing protein [Bacteroidia bacterium]
MRYLTAPLLLLAAFLHLSLMPPADPGEARGWIRLFDGRSLAGWTPKVAGSSCGTDSLEVFRAERGVLKAAYDRYRRFDGRFAHLFYRQPFSSFVLRLEYRFTGEMLPDAPVWCYRNSGVMYHAQSPESMELHQGWPVSLEAQLLSSTDSVLQTTANMCTPGTMVHIGGALTDEHCIPSRSRHYPDSQWIRLELIVQGNRFAAHLIEGDTVLTFTRPQLGGYLLPESYPLPAGTPLHSGYIALQAEGQPVEFRNIRLKPLPPE